MCINPPIRARTRNDGLRRSRQRRWYFVRDTTRVSLYRSAAGQSARTPASRSHSGAARRGGASGVTVRGDTGAERNESRPRTTVARSHSGAARRGGASGVRTRRRRRQEERVEAPFQSLRIDIYDPLDAVATFKAPRRREEIVA